MRTAFSPALVADAGITMCPFANSNGASTERIRSRFCSKSSATSRGPASVNRTVSRPRTGSVFAAGIRNSSSYRTERMCAARSSASGCGTPTAASIISSIVSSLSRRHSPSIVRLAQAAEELHSLKPRRIRR